jgi:hypothetical protein
MLIIDEINDLHAWLGSARTLAEYVRALKALGVEPTIPTWLTAIRSTSGRAATGSSPHRSTRCFRVAAYRTETLLPRHS